MDSLRRDFLDSLLAVDWLASRDLARAAARELTPLAAVEQVVVPSLNQVGTMWEEGAVSLSQVYMAGKITEEILEELLPLGRQSEAVGPPVAVVALNDFHLLGARVVFVALRANGFRVHNLGRMTVPELLDWVRTEQVAVLFVSTLMLASALEVKALKQGLAEIGRPEIRLVVGGAPFRFDPLLAKEVGADATGLDASEAVQLGLALLGGREELEP